MHESLVVFGTLMRCYSCSWLDDDAWADEFRRSQTELRGKLQQQQQEEQERALRPSVDGAAPAPPAAATAASLSAVAAIAALAGSLAEKRSQYLHWLYVAELQHAFIVALAMADFNQHSLELFPNFHPPAVRAHFTACLLDRASQSAGLPVLPLELLQIIGEYEPADLPYRPQQPLPEDEEVFEAAFVDQRIGGLKVEQEAPSEDEE